MAKKKRKLTFRKRILHLLDDTAIRMIKILAMAVLSVVASEFAEYLSQSHVVDSTVTAIITGTATAMNNGKKI